MKLSNNTTNILKNFSQINQSILIKQGNKLKTISVMKNILAEFLRLRRTLNRTLRSMI